MNYDITSPGINCLTGAAGLERNSKLWYSYLAGLLI